jgi:hypothetical protein
VGNLHERDVIFTHHALQYANIFAIAYVTTAQLNIACQNMVTVFRYPNYMCA